MGGPLAPVYPRIGPIRPWGGCATLRASRPAHAARPSVRHCEPARHLSPVIASPREARAKQSRIGAATMYASRPSHAARPAWIASAASRPRNDGGRRGLAMTEEDAAL